MVRVEYRILAFLWAAFYLYWFISAMRAKRNARSGRTYVRYRILFIAIVLALFYTFRGFRRFAMAVYNPSLAPCGLILCALGLSLAVWARKHLGRNWGIPMSVKEDPELVTTGPYRYVRHPIYSGILLAMLGTALAVGAFWLILLLFAGPYFVISARTEERLLLRQFPDSYPEYRARTKMIVPFVW